LHWQNWHASKVGVDSGVEDGIDIGIGVNVRGGEISFSSSLKTDICAGAGVCASSGASVGEFTLGCSSLCVQVRVFSSYHVNASINVRGDCIS
jgi:hypothetical protein